MNYLVCFISSLVIFGCLKTPNGAPIYPEDPTIVTFLVDMSRQIELENFNIDNDYLDIAGDFLNDWDGTDDYLNDVDGDRIYEITFTNLVASEIIQFKFRINGDTWETPNPEVSNCSYDEEYDSYNRIYTVEQGEKSVEYWYNDDSGN